MFKHTPLSTAKIVMAVLLILTVLSVTVFSPILSSTKFHENTLQTIDNQKQQAIGLSVAIAGASTALSTLPDDMASPLADELADLSFPLFLIVCFLYLEKFLLTTFGWISGTFLFPGSCLLAASFIYTGKERFLVWSKKLLVLTLALLLIIPAGAKVSNLIETTFEESINQTFHAASHLAGSSEETEKESNAFLSFISGLKDNVTSLVDTAKNMLNTFVDAIAVLIITSCIIPILTALAFIGVVKFGLNVEIPVKKLAVMVYPRKRHNKAKAIKESENSAE